MTYFMSFHEILKLRFHTNETLHDSTNTGYDMRYNFFEIENRAEFLPTLYGSKKTVISIYSIYIKYF